MAKNLYQLESADSPKGYQFDFYAGNAPKTEDEEVNRKIREREKRTGVPLVEDEIKLSPTAKFVNDMYEYSYDADENKNPGRSKILDDKETIPTASVDLGGLMSTIGESMPFLNKKKYSLLEKTSLLSKSNDPMSNVFKDIYNKSVASSYRDMIKSGIVDFTYRDLNAIKNGLVGFDDDEYNTGNLIYTDPNNDSYKVPKDEALGELSYAIGGLQEAVRFYKNNKDLLRDTDEKYTDDGIISGVTLDGYKKQLKSFSNIDFRGMNKDQVKAIQDKMLAIGEKAKENDITVEDVQDFQTNTKLGRKIKADQFGRVNYLIGEADKLMSKMYDKKNISTVDDRGLSSIDWSRAVSGAEVYINSAKNLLESTRPGSVNGAIEGAVDIGKSVATAATSKFPNWIYDTTNALTDIFGATNDPRKAISEKLIKLNESKIEVTESDIKKVLTKEEYDLLSAFSIFEMANQLRNDNQSLTWKIGQGVYDSAQFIADMWIGGKGVGLASKAIKAIGTSLKIINASKYASKAASIAESASSKALSTQLGEATLGAIRGEGISALKTTGSKVAKYAAKEASKGAFMTGTYAAKEEGEFEATNINRNGLVTNADFKQTSLEDYAYEAASNSLSALVEAGGIIRPGIKFVSAAIPQLGKIQSFASGIKSALSSSVASAMSKGVFKFMHADDIYTAITKLSDNNFVKQLNVDSIPDEMFEEWEEHTLRGGKQSDFFEKDNLIVTLATVGIFSGLLGSIQPATYASQLIKRKSAEKKLDNVLINKFGFSGESLAKIKSLIDNTPIAMLNSVVSEISARAQESLRDLNNSKEAIGKQKLIVEAANELNKNISKYVAHNYRLSAMRESLPKDVTQAESFLKEAFGSIEGDIASRAVENVSNEDTGNVEKVFLRNLQKEAFLVGGVDINEDGSISERIDDNGNPVMAKVMMPKSGEIKEVPASYIMDGKISESRNKEQLISEIAEFNTSASVLNSMIDPDGNAHKRSNDHKKRLNIVDDSESRNPGMKFGDGKDFLFPSVNKETGEKTLEHRRLVKDDSNGTYRWLKVDKNTDEVIDDIKPVEPVSETDAEPVLSKDGRKVIEASTEMPQAKIRSAIEEPEEDESDGIESDPSLYVESISDAEKAVIRNKVDIDESVKSNEKLIDKADVDQIVSKSSEVSAAIGDVEEVFAPTASAHFEQKYNEDVSIIDDTFFSEFSFLDEVSEETVDIIINKLRRDASARKVDRVANQYIAKTLVFINKYFKGYDSTGNLIGEESDPTNNSKVLLNGDWYDKADVSISSIALETLDSSGKLLPPERAPLITLTNPDNPSEKLMFTLKSKRILKNKLDSGKITPIEYDRAILLQENILKAVRSKSGINLAIGLGKPKMSSFRLSRKTDPITGKPIELKRRTIADTNTGIFTMDKDGFNFCFRFMGTLYSFSKGSSKADMMIGVNDVGSTGFASMSMQPPVIENAKRDYTPILGPVIDDNLAAIVSEIVKAPKGTLIAPIIDALGSEYMFGQDKFINGVLLNSNMTTDEFIELFLTSESDKSEGVYVLAGNIYNTEYHSGNIKTDTAEHIQRNIVGGSLNLNISSFFDEQMNLLPVTDVLKVSEQVANDYFNNDLHTLFYEYLATTDLDFGFYDPPFLFISERGEFETDDLADGGVTVSGYLVENSNELPQDILDMINSIYNKRSKTLDNLLLNESLTMDEVVDMANEAGVGDESINFKATTNPSKAAKNVMQEVVSKSLMYMAEKMFGAKVIFDQNIVNEKYEQLKKEGKLEGLNLENGFDGFVYDGVIYLNGFKVDGYGHEMAHLLVKSMLKVMPKQQAADFEKSILEFAKTNPAEVDKLSEIYKGEHSPELEFFCNEFGSAFDKHFSNRVYTSLISKVFKYFADITGALFGIGRKKAVQASFYNHAAKYAFNASMSDFMFIKEINDSNNSLAKRCSDMAMFCKKLFPGPISGDAKIRKEVNEILENTITSNLRFSADGKKYNSNLSNFEIAYFNSKSFKKLIAKSGIQLDENGHPIKLYIDQLNASVDGSVILTNIRRIGSNVSGFLVTDNVLEITNLDEIHEFLNDKRKQEELKDIYFNNHGYDAIKYKIDGKYYFIMNGIDKYMTSDPTDRNAVASMMENSDSIRRNKAISMLEDGHSIGSIIANTGFYPIQDANNNLIKINFSNEKINMTVAKKAILTGEPVSLSDLYSNDELMNLINSKDVKVRIITSDNVPVSNTNFSGGIVTITVNGAVNKFDYKNIVRDAVYNIIANGSSVFDVTPFYVTTNTSYSSDKSGVGATDDPRLNKALELRDKALDMWNDAISKNLTEGQLDVERIKIFKETGWMMNNSNSMTSSILLDYNEIIDNLLSNVSGSKEREFMLKDFIPSFINGGRLSQTKVVFDDRNSKATNYDYDTNTISIGKRAFSVSKDGSILLSDKNMKRLISPILHEASHATSMNMSDDIVYNDLDNLIMSNVYDINRKRDDLYLIANGDSDAFSSNDRLYAKVALNIVDKAISSGSLKSVKSSEIDDFIDDMISDYISKGFNVKGKIANKKIKVLFYKTIFSNKKSKYIRSIEESTAFGSEGNDFEVFKGPIFRILENFGTSIKRDVNARYEDNKYSSIGRNGDLYFSIPASDKPIVDVSTAFKSISRAIINSSIKNAKTENDIRRIAQNSIDIFKSQFDISGDTDISAIVGKHVDNLIDSLSSTVTDFYSFINFIPYEYNGVIQVTDRAAVENKILDALNSNVENAEHEATELVNSINKLLINSDSKIDKDLFVNYFKSINRSKTTSSDVFNKMSSFAKSRSYIDQKLLKDTLYYIAKNSSNVNVFVDRIKDMSIALDPVAKGITDFSVLAENLGMSNYYERLYTQFKQNNTSFLDSNAKNMTEVQLAINKNSGRKKINSIISDMPSSYIKSMTKEALSFSGADQDGMNGNNTDGIIIFFERLGIAVDKKTANIYASQYSTQDVSSMIKSWSSDIHDKRSSGISSQDSIGKAIDDIAFIVSSSESTPIKKDGSTFPSMSKFNAISQSIEDINNLSAEQIVDYISKNKYRSSSVVLEKIINSGNKIKIHKQIDSFNELEDATVSDIIHLLSGYISLGKISTDGTRYYISGHNIFEKYLSYNYDSDVDKYYSDGSVVNKINVNKVPVFSDFFKDGTILNKGLISQFKKYVYAELNSIIDAHSAYCLGKTNLIDGYHIGKNGKPGVGCLFTDYMNGIRLSAKSPNGAIYDSLNDAIDKLTDYEKQFLGSKEGVESLRSQLKDFGNNTSDAITSNFSLEVDKHFESGYLDNPGSFARLMIKKMLITGGINIDGLKSNILDDVNSTIAECPNMIERLSAIGDDKVSLNPKGAIAVAYLNALISKIEASKFIFGSPSEYGSIVKMEKRTQSWNTTYSIPSLYDDMEVRPNGEEVPEEFSNNEFKCEFGMDFEKEVLTGPYEDVSDTLGTVLISPSMYREMLIRSRGWTKEAENAYNKLIKAGKSGGDLNSVVEDVKFNPLKLIYVGEYVDDYGVSRKTMIKAQFIPLFNDRYSRFKDLYEKFTDENIDNRIHMYAMRDSIKVGFSDKMVRSLKFENLGMISIPRDEKKKDISLIRKLLLFNDPNFHSAIESNAIKNVSNLMNDLINDHGVIDAEYIKNIASDLDGIDIAAALDNIIELQKEDPTVNPLDFVGMFEAITNKINSDIADAFDFKMKGTQCSAVTERFFSPSDLEFVNDEGTMDVMVPMEYFADIVKGLSYEDAVDKLTKFGYINGPMSNCMVARNPVQGHSSISPAKIVGVFPRSYGFCISAPSEFLKANGGDYDGDKYFLFSVSNEGTPESNKLMNELLKSQRKTMEGNVDDDMNKFTDMNDKIESQYPFAKNTKSKKNMQTSQYKSEVSGLGLVGVCVNMISGLLSFIKHDVSLTSDGKKIVRSKKEIDESLSVVSALFSLAVDIATNPLLQDLGVSSRAFKIAFAIASVSDLETTVKFLHSNLTNIKPETDGVTNFSGLMSTNSLKHIITDALENPRLEPTEEQQVMINTLSKLGTIFITLKHSDDFYDFIRNNGYFDSILQSVKINDSVNRISKANPNIKGFNAANVSSTGLANASRKLNLISNVLTNSSDFLSKEFIVKFYEQILKDEKQSNDYYDQEYEHLRGNRDEKVNFEGFKTKVVLDKINSYVSNKIGISIFKGYTREKISKIKEYMISNHNISFSVDKTYIHSVTASRDTLYRLGEIAEPGTMLGDFFSLYYASAAQSGMIVEENKKIKSLKESGEAFAIQNDPNSIQNTTFMRLPGKIVSMKHAVKFGVSYKNSNRLSKSDIHNFDMKGDIPTILGYEKVLNIITSKTPIEYTGDGNNRIDVSVNIITTSNGSVYDSVSNRTYNVKGKYTLTVMNAIKDLIYSIENKIPFINTTLNEQTVSAVLTAIEERNNANRIDVPVHIATDDKIFSSKIWNGRKTTESDRISDALPGSTVITKNLNNVDYYEIVNTENGSIDMDVYDMANRFNYSIVNINKNVYPQLGFGNIKGQFRDADAIVDVTKIQDLVDDFVGFNIVNLSKLIDKKSVYPTKGSVAKYNVFDSNGVIVSMNTVTVNSVEIKDAPNGDKYRRYNVSDSTGAVSIVDDYNGDKLSAFVDLQYLNDKGIPNVVIIVDNASKFNLNRVSNINNYTIIQTTDNNIPYKKMNLEKDDKYNKMCTI